MDVLHTAIWVSDLEASKAFYLDGLGLNYSRNFSADGVRNYFVTGKSDAEIQFKHDPDGDGDVTPDGIDHLAVVVENAEATFTRLTEDWGSDAVKKPTQLETTGSTIAFVTDPDGYTVELIQKA